MELERIIEAALLVAGEPLDVERLQRLLPAGRTASRAEVLRAIDRLTLECAGRALELAHTAGGYRYQVRAAYADTVAALLAERAPRYSRAVLETLAIIAYRQPVTRADIEDIRGVGVGSGIIKTLLERGWVRVLGHREVPGRPAVFGTTKAFLDHFGLRSLGELPALADLANPDDEPTGDLQLSMLAPTDDHAH
ncbi:SMC-Scp complex subunit ScpB [Immundisolibacter sp.]|uniref:SMC-Scp complex subunit ScpB n=1 Tax=Immundisolibacter sp. TaxID=1934948 RepID=UPI002637A95C|nr:SMC-Scp complex subunit ScpB [Immundisolibacter sp.]MDD3651069.1 SMC-Scp complex subunit ScpB [Immundisolibacter sp.]